MASYLACCGSQCIATRPRQCQLPRCITPKLRSFSTPSSCRHLAEHRRRLQYLEPVRSSASSEAAVVAGSTEEAGTSQAAEGPQLTTVVLRKPVGIVFAQNKGGPVFVEELTPGGAAEQSSAVAVGDVLASCSAVVLKAGKEGEYERRGHGARPYDNFERIEFSCEGQEFKTVMNALKSNNTQWGYKDVTLTFRKPDA